MIHPILQFLKTAPYTPPFDLLDKYRNDQLELDERIFVSDFLRSKQSDDSILNIPDDDEIAESHQNSLNNLTNILKKGLSKNKTLSLSYRSDAYFGQIWSTRNTIHTILAEEIHTYYPYHVLIKTLPQPLNDKYQIIRVQPISFITEFVSIGDIFIDNPDILGQPFIIETWNEQPMLQNNLYKYIQNIDETTLMKHSILEIGDAPEDQISQFRYLEIENTFYLRKPVLSIIEYFETNHKDKEPHILNFQGSYTILDDNHQMSSRSNYALAAKLGLTTEDGSLVAKKSELAGIPYQFFIRSSGKLSHLVLHSESNRLRLYDSFLKPLSSRLTLSDNKEFLIYENLAPGIYYVTSDDIDGHFRLVLKLAQK